MADEENLEEERQEREHFLRIRNAFSFYRIYSLKRVNDSQKYYNDLSEKHKLLIPNFEENLCVIRQCIERNHEIIKLILKDTDRMFENKNPGLSQNDVEAKKIPPTSFDMDKVKTTLKQFSRDWSTSGAEERQQCYDPVINTVIKLFPAALYDTSAIHILVPGAGLGRLAYELANAGYTCQGNEWSLFMLFASNFVLNKCSEINSFSIYPWIHQWSNHKRTADQTQPIKFPDVNPELSPDANFSMAAGDFLEVYNEPESWHCVATVFFLDTAHNAISYIEKIFEILKPGGYWINLGPLLFHYEDLANESSIELSYEEISNIMVRVGFLIETEELNVKTCYTQNPLSMLQYEYRSVFFVAKKPVYSVPNT